MTAPGAAVHALLALAVLALAMLTGRLHVALAGPRRLRAFRPLEAALCATLGVAWWTVLLTAASSLGLRMPAALRAIAALHAVAIVLALARGAGSVLRPRGSPRVWAALLAPAALLGLFALYPTLRHGRFAAENDSLLYTALAQWYGDHSFAEPVGGAGTQPLSHYAAIYREAGFPIAPAFLLSAAAAATGARSPLASYPVLSACGLVLGLLALLGVGRRVLQWPVSFTAAAGLGLSALLQPMTWAHHMGFLAQTFAIPLLLAALMHLASLRAKARLCAGEALLLALLAGALACTYPPLLVPLAAAALASLADHVARGTPHRPLVLFGAAAVLGAGLLSWAAGLDLLRAFRFLGGLQVGGHVDLSPWGFLQASLGTWVYMPFRLGSTLEGLRYAEAWLAPFLALLAARGLLAFSGSRAGKPLLAAWLALAGAFVWYALFVRDPWTGERGHTWNLFKLTGWAFPILALAALHGLATLRTQRWGRAVARALLVAVLGLLPVHVGFADRLGLDLEAFVGTKPALAGWERLRAAFLYEREAWYLAADTPGSSTRFLPTYLGLLTYPRPLAGNWEGALWIPKDPGSADARLFAALARGEHEADGLDIAVVVTSLRGRITDSVEPLAGAIGLVKEPSAARVTALLQAVDGGGRGGCAWLRGPRTALRVYSPISGRGVLHLTATTGSSSSAVAVRSSSDVELPLALERGAHRVVVTLPDTAGREGPSLCVQSSSIAAGDVGTP